MRRGKGWSMGCALCLVGAAAVGCGPAETTLAERERPIIDGVPDTDPAHMAVVALYDEYALCSGTLIDRRVVLTAGHCLYGRDGFRVQVFFGNQTQGAEHRGVAAYWVHPGYDPHTLINDVSLLRLSSDPPAGVEPIPHLPAALGLVEGDVGSRIQFVGFGRDEKGEFSQKLTIFGTLGWVCPEPESCAGQGFPTKQGTICYDSSQGGPCFGDSGGPALVLRQGGEYVAGITSYVTSGSCLGIACSTKVDAFDDFIHAFMAADTELGQPCQEDQVCLSGHCTDGVCCDYACDAPCESCAQAGELGHCHRLTDDASEPGCAVESGCTSAGGRGGALGWLVVLGLLTRRRRA